LIDGGAIGVVGLAVRGCAHETKEAPERRSAMRAV
jgi:hypothetical protein